MDIDIITERLRDLAEDIVQYYYEAKTASRPEIKQWADSLCEIVDQLDQKDRFENV